MGHFNKISSCAVILLLAGCAAKSPEKTYTWNGYEDSVYQYYTHETSPQEQIASLQKLIEQSRASNKPVPRVSMLIWECSTAKLDRRVWQCLSLMLRKHSTRNQHLISIS
jgi:hypothetical protein